MVQTSDQQKIAEWVNMNWRMAEPSKGLRNRLKRKTFTFNSFTAFICKGDVSLAG